MTPERLILDACCIFNLYATGEMKGILELLPKKCVIRSRCRQEVQWLRAEQGDEREKVDLDPLLQANLLEEQSLVGPREVALFVELSSHMEDGEAEAAALAINRGHLLATGERKVRRVLASHHPSLHIQSTADLLYEWQVRSHLSDEACSRVLRLVTLRARFLPPRSDGRRDWWLKHTQS